jgi:vitellogenic carboxypeptidase-like protein
MFGLFLENGPLRVAQNGNDFTVSRAERAWADDYHVIYIDQPINTGFSFGNHSLTSMADGADEFVSFLVGFFQEYQDLSTNQFYLTGESYAGKYLPLFTQKILQHNKDTSSNTI